MAFDHISKAALTPGKTIPLSLDMLPGTPVIDVEHLGDENASYLDDEIAKANAKGVSAGSQKGKKVTPARLVEIREKRRDIIAKHAIRHLKDVKHSDGKQATDAEIPAFAAALPGDVVDKIWDIVTDAELFRERSIDGDPKALAEK